MVTLALLMAACSSDDSAATDGGGTADAAADAAGDGGLTPPQELCNCLLINCHEPYHAQYGEGDEVAIPACEADAESLPTAGMDTMSGNFLECRQAFCDLAATDATNCPAALGGAPCM